jgi:hypothetical protein
VLQPVLEGRPGEFLYPELAELTVLRHGSNGARSVLSLAPRILHHRCIMGYDTALLLLYKARHAVVGVAIAGDSGSYSW